MGPREPVAAPRSGSELPRVGQSAHNDCRSTSLTSGGTMSLVVTLSGSPSAASRSQELATHVGAAIAGRGFEIAAINVRDLPAEDLLHARADSPALQRALGLVERARGVVISTPVYKASYT